MKAYLNASEVAKLFNVDRSTVTRWIRRGVLRDVVRIGDAQRWRIPIASYQAVAQKRA
jgi:excisionase family DNA binding protein